MEIGDLMQKRWSGRSSSSPADGPTGQSPPTFVIDQFVDAISGRRRAASIARATLEHARRGPAAMEQHCRVAKHQALILLEIPLNRGQLQVQNVLQECSTMRYGLATCDVAVKAAAVKDFLDSEVIRLAREAAEEIFTDAEVYVDEFQRRFLINPSVDREQWRVDLETFVQGVERVCKFMAEAQSYSQPNEEQCAALRIECDTFASEVGEHVKEIEAFAQGANGAPL